jgi:hypothetical protein
MTVINPQLSTAVVIGNGSNLAQVNLSQLSKIGTTFGCNALYRIFKPDFLVAIDAGMIEEISTSDYPKDRFIIPSIEEQHEPRQLYVDLGYDLPTTVSPVDFPRSNAGMNAMIEAIRRGHKQLVIIGFDFIVASSEISTSNFFESTRNYGALTKATFHDTVNRMRYLNWFLDQHPDIKFIFVYPIINGSVTVWEFTCSNTILGLSYEELNDYCASLK